MKTFARQTLRKPAAWMHTHKATGQVKFGLSPMYDCDFNAARWDSVALYAAPAQAVDLGRFRKLASWVANCTGHGVNDAQRRMGEELLALIDSQVKPK